MRDLLVSEGQRAAFFTGRESSKQRERSLVDFQDDPAVSVLFLSDAGGTGLNLQRAPSCCVNLELPWNPAVLEQRIARIYRLGQERPIDVFNLVTEEGIEARIAGLIAQKQAVFSTLFDGTSEEVRFDGDASFLEGVKKLVEPVVPPVPLHEEDEDDADADLLAPPDSLATADTTPNEATSAESAVTSTATVLPETQVGTLLSGLAIQHSPDGGVRVEAPAEVAVPLAEFLESLARSLRT